MVLKYRKDGEKEGGGVGGAGQEGGGGGGEGMEV